MKKSLLFVVILIAAAQIAFARHKKVIAKNDLISVTMHRTACFGRCPDYEVKVNRDGLVTYTGYMFVKDSGTYEKNIGAYAVKQTLVMCKTYRVDTCQDVYNNMVPDLPGLYITLQYKSVTKKIINASFGPGFLREIANSMDALSKVDKTWEHVTVNKTK
jgi:hypothetical protein